jgi:isoleucyl-tRNA synthetase
MFKTVPHKLNLTILEEEVLRFWKSHRILEKSTTLNEGKTEYVFYEGPPTVNSMPGVHHALARAYKDVFPRFHLMRGKHVIRKGGWDAHGLPVEITVEKKLGFSKKSQIEAHGIDNFNQSCRQAALESIHKWESFTDRMGFWLDLENASITFSNTSIESVWWIIKTLWDKGLLYQGYKVVPYCPRCETPLSDHEVAQGYDQIVDPSIYVRLPLVEDPGTSLLVWTITPWALSGNAAVAAHPDAEYVIIERDLPEGGTERLILAQSLLEKIFGDKQAQLYQNIRVHETFKGRKLKGLRYRPLFQFLTADKPVHYVVLEDFVSIMDGSGLNPLSPAFGGEDMQAALDYDLPIFLPIGPDGAFTSEVRPWRGLYIKNADPLIIQDLERRGLLLKSETYAHTHPFCWVCRTPLISYARNTWYVNTSNVKEEMAEHNKKINWMPENVRDERFGSWLENNNDWAVGRDRYWGTPLPVWECENCHHQLAVGSIQELSDLADKNLEDLDLHRPFVDEVSLGCPECKGQMKRVPDVLDMWFDSGAMPVAQWHYPFENQEIFTRQFPADFISEGVDQTRGWFYTLHAISTLLFNSECFRNVVCLGLIQDSEGQKMAASHGNVVDPWDILHEYGADALRLYLYTSGLPWQERRFSKEMIAQVIDNFTIPLWDVYSYFTANTRLDRWRHTSGNIAYSELDRWLRSELHVLGRDAGKALENYDAFSASQSIQSFVTILTKWYLGHSRGLFGKSTIEAGKNAFYETLYQALTMFSKLLAPIMPFIAEEIYQNLVRSVDKSAPESVHLCAWPLYDERLIDENLNMEMAVIMKLASLGHEARKKAGLKARQPLTAAFFQVESASEAYAAEKHACLLADELNVKQVKIISFEGPYLCKLETKLTRKLVREGLAQEFIYCVQNTRKESDLEITDCIHITIDATEEIVDAIQEHHEQITNETQAASLSYGAPPIENAVHTAELDGQKVDFGIMKAG